MENITTKSRSDRDYRYFKSTRSVCPHCMKLVNAKVIFENNKVYFLKYCSEHGHSKALVSEDAKYYEQAYSYSLPGSQPLSFSTDVKDGCPSDCGLCSDHEQHTCMPIIEITDYCNLECPVCIVDNQSANHMKLEDFKRIIDNLLTCEGSLDNVTISGGEPTYHPKILDIIDIASRADIARVALVTNGIRIAKDESFCEELAKRNVYVVYQLDGFTDDVLRKIRGKDLIDIKMKGLENLEKYQIRTQLSYVPCRGVNEHQIGDAVNLLVEKDFILSLMFQPMSYTGSGGSIFEQDPLNRITIPGVINAISEQVDFIEREDFIPLQCSHPQCVSLTYLLKLDDDSLIPFPRFAEIKKYLRLFRTTATIKPNEETEFALKDIITNLWSTAGEIPDSKKIRNSLRKALLEMFQGESLTLKELNNVAERQAKTIFIHHYMDRHDFDLERLRKCCHHYPQIDGRIMPACSFNAFHR